MSKKECDKRYRAKHKKERNEKLKLWQRNNREKLRAQWRRRYHKNKAKIKARQKKYRERNKERLNAKNRKWHKDNRRRAKDHNLRRNYNLSIEDYERLYNEQKGLCAICFKFCTILVVDHIHNEEKKIRALLCNRCNGAIGFLNTPELLQAAKLYLEKYGYEAQCQNSVSTEGK